MWRGAMVLLIPAENRLYIRYKHADIRGRGRKRLSQPQETYVQ